MQDFSLLNYFQYGHLPEELQEVSKPFHDLATEVTRRRPASAATIECLKALLIAKDWAVRSML